MTIDGIHTLIGKEIEGLEIAEYNAVPAYGKQSATGRRFQTMLEPSTSRNEHAEDSYALIS
jgi:hypothetical protein